MVDCRCTDRLVQPRLRHPAYAFAAVNKNPACGPAAYRSANQHAICHIAVIPGVFGHGAAGRSAVLQHHSLDQGCRHRHAFGRGQRHSCADMARQQQPCGSRRRQSGASACGIAAAEPGLTVIHIMCKGLFPDCLHVLFFRRRASSTTAIAAAAASSSGSAKKRVWTNASSGSPSDSNTSTRSYHFCLRMLQAAQSVS